MRAKRAHLFKQPPNCSPIQAIANLLIGGASQYLHSGGPELEYLVNRFSAGENVANSQRSRMFAATGDVSTKWIRVDENNSPCFP